jgi:hypothetical protein
MRAVMLAALAAALAAAPAAAQNIRIDVSGGARLGSVTATQDFTLPINREDAAITHDIDLTGGSFVDLGASFRVAGSVWVGGAVSLLTRTVEGALTADIPHPFLFNQPREVTGTISGLENTETGVHITVGVERPLSETLDLLVFGGPSFFTVAQDLVTDIDYDSEYPFDEATFASATTARVTGSVFGYNAGADVSYRLSPRYSVGALFRYTRGEGPLEAASGNEVDITAGGFMVGGGVRIKF